MHELSIATHLVRLAEGAARAAGAVRVTAVHLRLGALSGVVRDALDFAYEVATEGTLLEGSALVVEEVPVVVHCPRCDAARALPAITRFRCPVCDTPTPDLRSGREIEIDHLEIEVDDETEADDAPTVSGDGAAAPPSLPAPPWRR